MNEDELIAELCAGNERGYKELFSVYADRVFNTALSIAQNKEDAEDITQETFLEVYRSVASFRGESSLATWIYRVTVTKAGDHLKKKKTKKRFGFLTSLFGDDNSLLHDQPHFEHPGMLAENREHGKALFQAMNKLGDKQKMAFTLHKIEGLSHKEVATAMDISISAVESLIFRANENLKHLLSEYYAKM